MYKTLRAIVARLHNFDGYFISSQFYLFIKGLTFGTFWGSFFIFSWFNATIDIYWKHLSSSIFEFIDAFLFFNQSEDSIYDLFCLKFVLFVMHQLNWIENKIAPSHWCLYTNLIPWKKWLEKFINNIICIAKSQKFCIVALWIHYTLFIDIFKKKC